MDDRFIYCPMIRAVYRGSLATFLILSLMLVLLLGGCRSLLLATRAEPISQLVLTTLQDPSTFNYALNQEFPSIFLFCFRGLTMEDGPTGEILPDLAESWDISDDGLQVTFTLRKGLKWSDGKPLTADDVVFTYRDVIFNNKIPNDAKDELRIGADRRFPEIRKLDEWRVEFRLPEPFAPLVRTTLVLPPTW
jgi:peptide/nickel transport system substrate-binding protein